MAICPVCSQTRRTPQKRNSKVLAVKLLEPEFAVYYCNHCNVSGFAHPDKPSRVVDLVEVRRQQEQAAHHAAKEKQDRTRQALRLWEEAAPFRGSPAETYLLETRNIGDLLDTFPFLDQVFAYHPNCPFGGERYACMIALVRDIKSNDPVAIHRTALTKDDPPQKISRMSLGPVGGGAIKISPNDEVHTGLMIGEGIETVLSASKQFQFKPVWSLVDKGNLSKFPVLFGIECVTIAIDNDASGDGQRAAAECSQRQVAAGVEVIATQPKRQKDFNDIIRGRA
jgi:hypothetical protein